MISVQVAANAGHLHLYCRQFNGCETSGLFMIFDENPTLFLYCLPRSLHIDIQLESQATYVTY